MKELTELGLKHGTDKAFDHKFTEIYDDVFQPLKNKPLNILEIGILEGSSLRMLKEFFKKSQVFAIDIIDNTHLQEDRIKIEAADQGDPVKLKTIFEETQFDIIIDDGSHISDHQQISLNALFSRLKSKGIYIVEDLHTNLWSRLHYVHKDGAYCSMYDKDVNNHDCTTLTLLKKLKNFDVFQTDYVSESEFIKLKEEIERIDIFYLNDLESITAIIYKK